MNTQKQSILVAHRGLQPENTLWAFKQAYAQGFMAAECDVWLTRDNQVIVCHDETCQRTAVSNNELVNQPISSLSYEQLHEILVGNAQHSEPVPLLKDLLAIIPEEKKLLVEVKFKDIQAISYFIDCIKSYLNKIIVISFYPDILVVLKKLLPECQTILLTTAKHYHEQTVIVNDPSSLHQALVFVAEYNLDGLGFEYSDFIQCTPGVVQRIPGVLLTQIWYGETDPVKIRNIVDAASNAGIGFVNVDAVIDVASRLA